MKDCKECEFFEGYDYSDGTPYCDYERCPFNDYSSVKNKGMKIEIDAGFMHDYILHTLKNTIESEPLKSYATKQVKDAIDTYERKLRDDINVSIKNHFDAATRQVLTDNVVSMLMCNDTYKKLSDSMQTFLPNEV